jgi:hypothetical protein
MKTPRPTNHHLTPSILHLHQLVVLHLPHLLRIVQRQVLGIQLLDLRIRTILKQNHKLIFSTLGTRQLCQIGLDRLYIAVLCSFVSRVGVEEQHDGCDCLC